MVPLPKISGAFKPEDEYSNTLLALGRAHFDTVAKTPTTSERRHSCPAERLEVRVWVQKFGGLGQSHAQTDRPRDF